MITVQYFIDCVQQLCGLPQYVKGDCGTENIHIAAVQWFIRRNSGGSMARGEGGGGESLIYGKSVTNQRIEACWSF